MVGATDALANRSSLVHLPRFDNSGRRCGSDKFFRAALLEAIRSYWSDRRSMGVGSDKLNIPAEGFMQTSIASLVSSPSIAALACLASANSSSMLAIKSPHL